MVKVNESFKKLNRKEFPHPDLETDFNPNLSLMSSIKSWRSMHEPSEPELLNLLFSLISTNLVANLFITKNKMDN